MAGSKNLKECPDCGKKLVHAGGCVECQSCGWGGCS